MLLGKIWIFIILRYREMDLKLTSEVLDTSIQRLKRNVFTVQKYYTFRIGGGSGIMNHSCKIGRNHKSSCLKLGNHE